MSKNDNDRRISYGYRGVVKRDAQHSHDGPEVAPHKSKKKKGCKRNKWGPHVESEEWTYEFDWFRYTVCIHCGKTMTNDFKHYISGWSK